MAQESLKLLKERRKVEQDIANLKKETKDWGDAELRQLQELENRKKRIAKLEGKAAADRDKAELAYLGVASRVSTLQEDIGKRVERNGRSVFQLSNAFKIAASNMQPMVRGGVEMKDTYTGFASLMDDIAMNAEKAEMYLQGGSENMEATTSAMSSKIEELAKASEDSSLPPETIKEAEKLLEVYTGLDSRFKEATMTMGEGFNNINDLQSQSVGLAGEMALSYGKIGTSGFSVSVDKANELYDTSVKQAKLIKSVTLPDMKKKIKFMLKELELINPLSDEYKTMQSSIEEMQGDMEEMEAASESMVATAERNVAAADQMRIMNNQIAASSELILGPFNKLKGVMEALPFGGLVSSLVDLEGVGNKFGDTVQKNLLGMFSEPTVAMEAFALKSDKAGEKTGKRFRDLSTGQLVAGDDEAVLTLNDGMTTFTNIMGSAKEAVGAMGEGLNKLTGMPVAMAGPLLVVVGIILLAAKVAEMFFGGMMDTRKELGVTVAEAGKLQNSINSTAMEFSLLGVSAEDVAGISDSIRDNMGGLSSVTSENLSAMTQLTALYGISGENTGILAAQMMAVGASSFDAATSQMESVALLARASGVAPAAVMNDVAGSADAFAGFAKKGGENVFKAAIAARKLGLDMSNVEQIADSLLDFESSIEAQMEASMLTGRAINTDKARELALAGDLEGMQKEVTKQIGSAADFEKLNVVQRKSLAAAFGVSVSELGKMVANQDKLNNMTDAEKAHRDKMAKVMEWLGKAWTGFLSVGKALLPVVVGLGVALAVAFWPITLALTVITGIGMLFNELNKKVPMLGTVLGVILGLMTAIWMKSKLTGEAMSGGMMEGAKGMVTGLKERLMGGGITDKIKEKVGMGGDDVPLTKSGKPDKRFGKRADKTKAVKKPKTSKSKGGKKGGKGGFGFMEKIDGKKMIQGAAALLIAAAAMWVAAKALQEFGKVTWPAIAKAGVTLLGLTLVLAILGQLKGQLIQGAAAMLIMSIALIPFAFALQMFTGIDFAQVALGGVTMIGFALALGALGMMASFIIAGAAAVAVMGIALIPFALALRLFTDIDFEQVKLGGIAMLRLGLSLIPLGMMAPFIVMGAAAMSVMGIALVPFALALRLFTDIDFEQVKLGGATMLGLGLALGALGTMAPLIVMGATAMAVMGIALIPFSLALRSFTDSDFAQVVTGGAAMLGLGLALGALGTMAPLIILGSQALGIMSLALLGLGVALSLIGTGMNMISGSFSGITEQITQLATMADPILLLAKSFTVLGVSMGAMALGALTLLPALPVLFALNKLGLLGGVSLGGGGEEESSKSEGRNPVEEQLMQTNTKLEELIGVMSQTPGLLTVANRNLGTISEAVQ